MDPITIGVALHVVGGFLRANAARRAARITAAQERRNAMLAEMAAGDSLQRGQAAESDARTATSERISADQAQLGASGVDVKSGSALDILAGQRGRGEYLALKLRANAMREAWGFRTQADNFRYRADIAEFTGEQAATDEFLGGVLAGVQGKGGAGVAYPVLRIGEPTTFERPSYSAYNDQGI